MPMNTLWSSSFEKNQEYLMSYPVFPLPLFLLTGGMQRLRIFEQKYLSMVANATRTGGFVISLYKKESSFSSSEWGVHVNIIDFSNGEDGILTIDVLAENLVSLSDFYHDAKGLLCANAKPLPHWSSSLELTDQSEVLAHTLALFLKQVFRDNAELNQLYKHQHFEDAHWVSSRLLEVMPIPLSEQENFIHHLDLHQLNQMLAHLCEKTQPNSDR